MGWPRTSAQGLLAAALAALLCAPAAGTEPMPFPADVQIALLLKILTYDRSFQAKDDIIKTLQMMADRTIKNVPIKFMPVEYRNPASLETAVRTGGVNVFYVAPGNANG